MRHILLLLLVKQLEIFASTLSDGSPSELRNGGSRGPRCGAGEMRVHKAAVATNSAQLGHLPIQTISCVCVRAAPPSFSQLEVPFWPVACRAATTPPAGSITLGSVIVD